MIICRECGAQIEELAARCPYCGAINELGAEHKYMHDMHRLKGNLENLGNIPQKEIEEEIKSHFNWKSVLTILILILILSGVFLFHRFSGHVTELLYNKMTNTRTADKYEQMLWEQENFPKLDAWYEMEDYDSILMFCRKTEEAETGIYYSSMDWEHDNIVPFYEIYRECMDLQQRIEGGEKPQLLDFQSALHDALSMSYERTWFPQTNDKDKELVNGWEKKCYQFVKDTYQISNQEIDDLKKSAEKDDYLDSKIVFKYVEEHKDRIPVGE